jgi:hypothetical protein
MVSLWSEAMSDMREAHVGSNGSPCRNSEDAFQMSELRDKVRSPQAIASMISEKGWL